MINICTVYIVYTTYRVFYRALPCVALALEEYQDAEDEGKTKTKDVVNTAALDLLLSIRAVYLAAGLKDRVTYRRLLSCTTCVVQQELQNQELIIGQHCNIVTLIDLLSDIEECVIESMSEYSMSATTDRYLILFVNLSMCL